MEQPGIDVVVRFSRYYFGDQMLTRLEIDPVNRQVSLYLTGALLLKPGAESSIYDPERSFEPAVVRFTECEEVIVSHGSFAMNTTIVGFSAEALPNGRTQFRFALTGGWNNQTFWRELTFMALEFSVDPGR